MASGRKSGAAGLSATCWRADRQRCRDRGGRERSGATAARERQPCSGSSEAVEASYRALAGSVPVELETVAVLEEVSQAQPVAVAAGSRERRWALANADASLLKFLARGTLAIIAWMDGSPTHQLADLQQAIRVLAWGTSITTTAQPVLAVVGRAGERDRRLAEGQGVASAPATRCGSSPTTARRSSTSARRIAEPADAAAGAQAGQPFGRHDLRRRNARLSGDRPVAAEAWRARGRSPIAEPGTLLDKFYRRELDIRPGDALRCRVDFETSYGPDHEVLAERYRIVEIVEVLPALDEARRPRRRAPGAEAERHDRSEELEAALPDAGLAAGDCCSCNIHLASGR